MKVLIYGKKDIESLVKRAGLEIVDHNPDLVISHGGDGTLMRAEHEFPGIPKTVLRGSHICKKCSKLGNEEVLKRVKNGHYTTEEVIKLQATMGSRVLAAINDVNVHNKDVRHALRYNLWLDDEKIYGEIIGDGIVIATPFGSAAYYRSITDSYFEVGIGLAFNNSTEQSDHIVIKDNRRIKISIVRGPAMVYADNQDECVEVAEGDSVFIKKSEETAKILKFS